MKAHGVKIKQVVQSSSSLKCTSTHSTPLCEPMCTQRRRNIMYFEYKKCLPVQKQSRWGWIHETNPWIHTYLQLGRPGPGVRRLKKCLSVCRKCQRGASVSQCAATALCSECELTERGCVALLYNHVCVCMCVHACVWYVQCQGRGEGSGGERKKEREKKIIVRKFKKREQQTKKEKAPVWDSLRVEWSYRKNRVGDGLYIRVYVTCMSAWLWCAVLRQGRCPCQ